MLIFMPLMDTVHQGSAGWPLGSASLFSFLAEWVQLREGLAELALQHSGPKWDDRGPRLPCVSLCSLTVSLPLDLCGSQLPLRLALSSLPHSSYAVVQSSVVSLWAFSSRVLRASLTSPHTN